MAGFVGQSLRRDVGPVAPLAGPILVAAEVHANLVGLGVDVELREGIRELGRAARRRALRRGGPAALERHDGRASAADGVRLRAPRRHREARHRAVVVVRVELEGHPVVDAGRGVAGQLRGAHLIGPGVETGERHVQRRVVVEHDDARLVGGRLTPRRHPEVVSGRAQLPRGVDQPAVNRRRLGDALRGERAGVAGGRTGRRSLRPGRCRCGWGPHEQHQREPGAEERGSHDRIRRR